MVTTTCSTDTLPLLIKEETIEEESDSDRESSPINDIQVEKSYSDLEESPSYVKDPAWES